MSEKIFAYGSNMFSARFRDYGVIPDGQGRAALVCGYDLCFNKKSRDGSGKANVEPRTGGEVWGVLYSISDEHSKSAGSRDRPNGHRCLDLYRP